MLNAKGELVDLYVPRKCSATKRLIGAKEHGAVQINVGAVDENGQYSGKSEAVVLCGYIRQKGESDACMNRLLNEKGDLSFAI